MGSSVPAGWRPHRRGVLAAAGAALASAAGAAAAEPQVDCPPTSAPPETARQRQLREDFPWLARYAADNRRVLASGVRPDIVFLGDSITERWQRTHPAFFSEHRLCRGIGGQTTPQMLLRLMADVIALQPTAVHLLAGTNDIAGNTGPMTLEQSRDNVEAMVVLAQAYKLKVLIGSVPPAGAFRWSPDKRPAEPIRQLNTMLRDLAARHGATWIDYHAALTTPDGAMRDGLSSDGVHPLAAGYEIMEHVAQPALARVSPGRR